MIYESNLFDRIYKNSAKVKHEVREYQWGSIESCTMYKNDDSESLRFVVNAFHDKDKSGREKTTFSGWIAWSHPEYGAIDLFNSLNNSTMYDTLSDLMVDAVTGIAKKCEDYTVWSMAEDALEWLALR